jgi:Na+-translocating ferredoxin:NAD+ oxidoreductase RnfG subunit
MKKIVLLMVFIISLGVTGCQNEIDYSVYPDHFAQILKGYDEEYLEREDAYETEDIYRCYQLGNQEYYFITRTWGYEEDMLIGVKMNQGAVLTVDILFENESDKYGEYVTEDWFLERFIMALQGEMVLVKKQKTHDNEVVAITGATITSQGVMDGVNGCITIMEDRE